VLRPRRSLHSRSSLALSLHCPASSSGSASASIDPIPTPAVPLHPSPVLPAPTAPRRRLRPSRGRFSRKMHPIGCGTALRLEKISMMVVPGPESSACGSQGHDDESARARVGAGRIEVEVQGGDGTGERWGGTGESLEWDEDWEVVREGSSRTTVSHRWFCVSPASTIATTNLRVDVGSTLGGRNRHYDERSACEFECELHQATAWN
jgi:hypothetical protein